MLKRPVLAIYTQFLKYSQPISSHYPLFFNSYTFLSKNNFTTRRRSGPKLEPPLGENKFVSHKGMSLRRARLQSMKAARKEMAKMVTRDRKNEQTLADEILRGSGTGNS